MGTSGIEEANAWLQQYLRQHNQRFAVAARDDRDMHRPWLGTAQALREICALHHQRQLSVQGACRFQGQVLQVEPDQVHAPKARAMINIVQLANGQLSLSYRGKPLRHRAFTVHEHLNRSKLADAKTLPGRLDALRKHSDPERARLARLKAELDFQASQRARGLYRPDSPAIVPPRVSRQLRATPF